MGNTNRAIWLDILKGFAIVCIIALHALQRTIYYNELDTNVYLSFLNDFLYSNALPLFFLVSGIIFFKNREKYQQNAKHFIKTRFYDLIIPYLILGPLVWLGKFLLPGMVHRQVAFSDLLAMFTTPIAFLWFIYVLFFIEIIALCMDRAFGNSRKGYYTTLVVLFIIACTVPTCLSFGKINDVFHLLPKYLFWYYLGGVFVYSGLLPSMENKRMLYAVGTGITWIGFFTINFFKGYPFINNVSTLLGMIFLVLLFYNVNVSGIITKGFHYLGDKTLVLYILHPIIINGLHVILNKIGVQCSVSDFVTFFVGAIVIGCIINALLPKIPPLEFVFKPRKYLIKHDK